MGSWAFYAPLISNNLIHLLFQIVLTPIEVAIEDVQKKICELDAVIKQVINKSQFIK